MYNPIPGHSKQPKIQKIMTAYYSTYCEILICSFFLFVTYFIIFHCCEGSECSSIFKNCLKPLCDFFKLFGTCYIIKDTGIHESCLTYFYPAKIVRVIKSMALLLYFKSSRTYCYSKNYFHKISFQSLKIQECW